PEPCPLPLHDALPILGAGADALASELARFCETVVVADKAELAQYQPETCLNALTRQCAELRPRAVLFANDTYSQELTPLLAHRLDRKSTRLNSSHLGI